MVLNPQAVQIFLAGKSAERQEEMMKQGGGSFGGFGGNGGNGQNMLGQEENDEAQLPEEKETEQKSVEKSLRALEEFKKATRFQERVIRHVIE